MGGVAGLVGGRGRGIPGGGGKGKPSGLGNGGIPGGGGKLSVCFFFFPSLNSRTSC
tara:strand:- start:5453 stop:5620 length:168 start_codon:yes stop_codon:yes gene_type:complete